MYPPIPLREKSAKNGYFWPKSLILALSEMCWFYGHCPNSCNLITKHAWQCFQIYNAQLPMPCGGSSCPVTVPLIYNLKSPHARANYQRHYIDKVAACPRWKESFEHEAFIDPQRPLLFFEAQVSEKLFSQSSSNQHCQIF